MKYSKEYKTNIHTLHFISNLYSAQEQLLNQELDYLQNHWGFYHLQILKNTTTSRVRWEIMLKKIGARICKPKGRILISIVSTFSECRVLIFQDNFLLGNSLFFLSHSFRSFLPFFAHIKFPLEVEVVVLEDAHKKCENDCVFSVVKFIRAKNIRCDCTVARQRRKSKSNYVIWHKLILQMNSWSHLRGILCSIRIFFSFCTEAKKNT